MFSELLNCACRHVQHKAVCHVNFRPDWLHLTFPLSGCSASLPYSKVYVCFEEKKHFKNYYLSFVLYSTMIYSKNLLVFWLVWEQLGLVFLFSSVQVLSRKHQLVLSSSLSKADYNQTSLWSCDLLWLPFYSTSEVQSSERNSQAVNLKPLITSLHSISQGWYKLIVVCKLQCSRILWGYSLIKSSATFMFYRSKIWCSRKKGKGFR